MFVYQSTFVSLELKVNKNTEYIIDWKSKDLHKSKRLPLHGSFLPNRKYFMPKIAIQFNDTPLVVEQSNYATKIVNAYIVYDLDDWRKISLGIFIIKNCLFGGCVRLWNSVSWKRFIRFW